MLNWVQRSTQESNPGFSTDKLPISVRYIRHLVEQRAPHANAWNICIYVIVGTTYSTYVTQEPGEIYFFPLRIFLWIRQTKFEITSFINKRVGLLLLFGWSWAKRGLRFAKSERRWIYYKRSLENIYRQMGKSKSFSISL